MSEIENLVCEAQRMLREAQTNLDRIDLWQDCVWNCRREVDEKIDLFDPRLRAFNDAVNDFDFAFEAAHHIYWQLRRQAKQAGENLLTDEGTHGQIDALESEIILIRDAVRRAQKAWEDVEAASDALKQGSLPLNAT